MAVNREKLGTRGKINTMVILDGRELGGKKPERMER